MTIEKPLCSVSVQAPTSPADDHGGQRTFFCRTRAIAQSAEASAVFILPHSTTRYSLSIRLMGVIRYERLDEHLPQSNIEGRLYGQSRGGSTSRQLDSGWRDTTARLMWAKGKNVNHPARWKAPGYRDPGPAVAVSQLALK